MGNKLDALGNSLAILSGEGDEFLLSKISPDELWSEYGIPLQEESNYAAPVGIALRLEMDILASISKMATKILEIGTGEGATTLIMAKYSSPEASVHTIDLPPNMQSIVYEKGDSPIFAAIALRERTPNKYKYENTAYAQKIKQIFSDTKSFDETKLAKQLDFIFIDGANTYSYIKNDTQKALNMLKPGGILLWRNYESKRSDVVKFINEFSQKNTVHHIKGTTFVIYKLT